MWGSESWGEMLWGGAASIPVMGPLGLAGLAVALLLAGRALGRRAPSGLGAWPIGVALLLVPLAAWAAVSLPHTFVNGTVADADEVNANFGAVAAAIEEVDPAAIGVPAGEVRTAETSPPGWLPCDGSLVAIADYTALFEAIGNTYGGDGRNTLGLPNDPGKIIAAAEPATRRNPPIDQAWRLTGGSVPGDSPARIENLPLQFNSAGTLYLALELVQHSAGIGTVWLAIPKSHDLDAAPVTPQYVLAPDVVVPTS